MKQVVISLVDRLAGFAAREAENETPEEKKFQEEELSRRLAEKTRSSGRSTSASKSESIDTPNQSLDAVEGPINNLSDQGSRTVQARPGDDRQNQEKDPDVLPISTTESGRRFRGIPSNVPLFDIFWEQIVQLISVRIAPRDAPYGEIPSLFMIQVRPDLGIQDITALLVSLLNLGLSCYPDRIEYVDALLRFTVEKMQEFSTQ